METCCKYKVYISLQDVVEKQPRMMDTFTNMDVEDRPLYTEVAGFDNLRATLDAKLAEYNESNPVMDLVLFQQAWHI